MADPASRPGNGLIPVRIAGTSHVLPGRAVKTAELVEQLRPKRDAAEMEARTGIISRHFADSGTTATQLAALALREALADARMPAEALKRIIFIDSSGGDILSPANANLVAAALDLEGTYDCFDLNNACMGFLSALDVGARSAATGHGPVGIVVSEIGSRYITPDDPRPFLVFADACAAAILGEGRHGEGIVGWSLRNDGKEGTAATLAHPGVTGQRETIRFDASNQHMSRLAIEAVRRRTEDVLAQTGLALSDVDWFLPHQPNGVLLAAIIGELALDLDRVVPVVQDVGSVGAASIPISLDRLRRSGRVRPGDRILMLGVGAGLSSGAILYQVAP